MESKPCKRARCEVDGVPASRTPGLSQEQDSFKVQVQAAEQTEVDTSGAIDALQPIYGDVEGSHVVDYSSHTAQLVDVRTEQASIESAFPSRFQIRGRSYAVRKKLGQGSFSAVFSVCDDAGKAAAVKVVRRTQAHSLVIELLTSLKLTQCDASFIPRCYALDAVQDEAGVHNFMALVMEEAKCTLKENISGGMNAFQAMQSSTILACMLRELHMVGFVHQDFKPANCLEDSDGWPLIADFGCVATASNWPANPLGLSASDVRPLVGCTPKYAPPEVTINHVREVTAKADVWSWALVVLELFSVPLPDHPGREATLTDLKTWQEAVRGMAEKRAPEALQSILSRCLCVSPADRPESSEVVDYMMQLSNIDWFSLKHQRGAYLQEAHDLRLQVDLQAFDLLHNDVQFSEFCWAHLALDLRFITKLFVEAPNVVRPRTFVLQSLRHFRGMQDIEACASLLAKAARYMSLSELQDALWDDRVLYGVQTSMVQQLIAEAERQSEERIAQVIRSRCGDPTDLPDHVDLVVGTSGALENIVDLRPFEKNMLRDGADPDERFVLLLLVSSMGRIRTLQVLLEKGLDVNQTDDENGDFALLAASENGHVECVNALLKHRADVKQVNRQSGDFPLIVASENGHTECVKALLAKGASTEQVEENSQSFPLMMAAENGHEGCVAALLDKRADVNKVDPSGNFALLVASGFGHAECVKALLICAQGADLKQVHEQSGNFPLLAAAETGHVECVQALLKKGANASQINRRNCDFPLLVASYWGHVECVKDLLQEGADTRQVHKHSGNFPLLLASQEGHAECVRALLQAGASANRSGKHCNDFPLLMASQEGHAKCVKALLEMEADANQVHKKRGTFPLLLASFLGHVECVECLLGQGADVNQINNQTGSFPLLLTSEEGHVECAKVLLEHAANVNQIDAQSGETPLAVALQNRHTMCVNALQGAGARIP